MTDADIQAFFMSIDSLCKKYSRETSQILEFQEKHRKRLLAFYREKISRLEESLRKSVLQIEQLQSMRSSQQTAFSTIKSSVSTKPHGCLLPPHSSAPDRLESMEVDLSPSPIRKSEIAAGPARISMISPPQDGRMAPCARRVCHFQRFTMFLHRRLSSLAAPPSVQFWKARGTHQL
ncbi:putative E3 SUMO-protein ligase RNF212 isoform X10 [Homo sapiens]|uniref:putative E3 SUMO-protein ligase RNF212 isoform X10 n=1 Tax=Homo sapiens TaxID=9606 RepID=UPI001FB066AF|nr:probable E3 SUMO-protein ligase RNF212 isoform X10 [Homo sapiens]XP_054205700.1 probable E3 SUMO-protein ligase RNF212 isoform X10 [Homo sapiens]